MDDLNSQYDGHVRSMDDFQSALKKRVSACEENLKQISDENLARRLVVPMVPPQPVPQLVVPMVPPQPVPHRDMSNDMREITSRVSQCEASIASERKTTLTLTLTLM